MTKEQSDDFLFSCALNAKLYNSAQFSQVVFLFLVEKFRVQIANARVWKARAAQTESGSSTLHSKTELPLIATMTALCVASGNLANEVLLLLKTAANPKSINSNAAHNALKALLDILEFGSQKGQTSTYCSTTKTIWTKSRLCRLLALLPEAPKWRPKLLKQCAANVDAEALRATVLELIAEVSAKGKEKELTTQVEDNNTTPKMTIIKVDLFGFYPEAMTAIDLIFEGNEVSKGKPYERDMNKFGLIGMSQAISKESTESLTFMTAITFVLETLSQTFGFKTLVTDEGAVADAAEEIIQDAAESVSPLEKAKVTLPLVEERIYWRAFNVQKGPVPKKRKTEENHTKQRKALNNLVASMADDSWHIKLLYHLAVTETLPPKNMGGKHANNVLLLEGLRFIGLASSPYQHALIDEMTKHACAGLDTSKRKSSQWKALKLRENAISDAIANHLTFTKTCPNKDPFTTMFKRVVQSSPHGLQLVFCEPKKKLRPIEMGSTDMITYTLGNRAYQSGCPVYDTNQRRATITAIASKLRNFTLKVKIRLLRPSSSTINYILRMPRLWKCVPENDDDLYWIVNVPLELVEDLDEKHKSEARETPDRPQGLPVDSESIVDLMDFDELLMDQCDEEYEHNVFDPMDVEDLGGPSSSGEWGHMNIDGAADLESKEFPTTLLLEGLRKLEDFPERKDQQAELKTLLAWCASKQMGVPVFEMTEEKMRRWEAFNDENAGARDWIDVRVLRKLAERFFSATPWRFDESRDPEALHHFPRNLHILVIRNGVEPNKRRKEGLRWFACDPGSRIFICAYDPITGDIYLIGSEMGHGSAQSSKSLMNSRARLTKPSRPRTLYRMHTKSG
ncbi:hypothetical protein HDU86_002438 [Geranomyces michiganensis]|nr:hypothetical protein HDU86_002438 [Geranomyces michiganensis]